MMYSHLRLPAASRRNRVFSERIWIDATVNQARERGARN